jgi:hypothetical protein
MMVNFLVWGVRDLPLSYNALLLLNQSWIADARCLDTRPEYVKEDPATRVLDGVLGVEHLDLMRVRPSG